MESTCISNDQNETTILYHPTQPLQRKIIGTNKTSRALFPKKIVPQKLNQLTLSSFIPSSIIYPFCFFVCGLGRQSLYCEMMQLYSLYCTMNFLTFRMNRRHTGHTLLSPLAILQNKTHVLINFPDIIVIYFCILV